ncbi:28S ribosomal protein S34, mitochondrial-like [Asterias rubens]|uniref:28S ribosomal protein S34, mitochondrial-like n=1 Tax=Asterias rubens TaxID=7604 RepID=UPI001455AAF7|nr:28S ribosomal protein S34, mitochondrial-like [Asterias rubens]XP_033630783.1 28S ribosomal protein S34, mitochondrial-like [Asterias rubens]
MTMAAVHRHTWHTGKNLFSILTELPNFGVGRIVTRRRWVQMYPKEEPSYYKITRVKIDCTRPDLDQGEVWGECTYRGYSREGVSVSIGAWWKREWELIRKTDEEEFIKFTPKAEHFHAAPNYVRLPPLLEAMAKKQLDDKGVKVDENDPPLLKLQVNKGYRYNFYQIEGEKSVGEY